MANKPEIALEHLAALLLTGAIMACSQPAQAAEPTSPSMGPGPEVLSPAERIIVPDDLEIVIKDGPAGHLFSEFEIWKTSGGQPDNRVWKARLDTGDLTRVSLDGGQFETGTDSLISWTKYAIRARYGSANGVTEWGPRRNFRTDDGSEELFNPEVIRGFWLEIPEASWKPINDEALSDCAPHHRSYYPGTIRIGTDQYPGSGIRAKGGCGSSRTLDGKTAFKANMSWDDPAVAGCPESRRHRGLKKITLNNQVQDSSYTHERIGYDFFRKLGVPAPRAASARVHVNGELWGLYLHLDTIDRRFLSRHFSSNDGMLYEAGYGCDIGEESCFEEKFSVDACDTPREGDIKAIFPLRSLHGRLAQLPSDNIYPAIRQIMDFDGYLTMWAAASIMGYFDGYPFEPNNYRLYHDPSNDLWTVIPTGIDQLFERDVDPYDPAGLLSIRCLAEEDCRNAFNSKLSEVIDIFESSDYPAMARAIARQIEPAVEADPRREFSLSDWHAAVDSTVRYMERRPRELRDLLSRQARQSSKAPTEYFRFHALADPRGDRYVMVTWAFPNAGAPSGQQWIVAEGYFEALEARMDAYGLAGGSAGGTRAGSVIVSYETCETALFVYEPDDRSQQSLKRSAPIDSSIWKYCG